MTRNVVAVVMVTIVRAAVATVATAQPASARPNIAIADVAITPAGYTLPPPQMAGAIVELLVGELVGSQQFHVYDGQWLVPQEEAGGHANLARLRAAAAEWHVDYLVLGSVTAFSMVQTRNHGGGLIPLHTVAGGGLYSSAQSGLAVNVSLRIVDVRTGEIVSSASGEGTSRRKSAGFGALGFFRGIPLPLIAGAAHAVANARDAMLDEALTRAVHGAALELSKKPLPVTAEYQLSSAR